MSIKLRIASGTFLDFQVGMVQELLSFLWKMDLSESDSAVVINSYQVDLGIWKKLFKLNESHFLYLENDIFICKIFFWNFCWWFTHKDMINPTNLNGEENVITTWKQWYKS
jgi:hypothetical protein